MAGSRCAVKENEDKSKTDLKVVSPYSPQKKQLTDHFGAVVKDIAIVAADLRLDYRAGQIGHSVANGSPPQRRFCVAQAVMDSATRHTLRRNTANIMKF